MATRYVCWSDPNHDLTELVEGAREDPAMVVVRLLPSDGESSAADGPLLVTCPRPHPPAAAVDNVFGPGLKQLESRGKVGEFVVAGRPPTPNESAWAEAAKELSPEKSLNRASESAKWVVSSISLVATVVGGFGIVAGVSDNLNRHLAQAIPTILFATAALVAAVFALIPSVKNVRTGELKPVQDYYVPLIKRRGRLTQVSTIFLIAAVLSGVWLALVAASDPGRPAADLTATWDGSGGVATLTLDASVKGIASGTSIEATVEQSGVDRKSLASASGSAGADGTAKVSIKFRPEQSEKPFVLTIKSGDTVLQQITVDVPTFTPSPAAPGAASSGGTK